MSIKRIGAALAAALTSTGIATGRANPEFTVGRPPVIQAARADKSVSAAKMKRAAKKRKNIRARSKK